MTNTPTWPEYLRRITGGLPPADIARRSGIPLSTVTRWLAGETKPSAAKLAQLSQFFPMRIDEAHAVVANYTPAPRTETAPTVYVIDGQRISRPQLLRMFSDLEISRELVRRIDEHDSITTPQPFTNAMYLDDNVVDILLHRRDVGTPSEDDLDAVARPTDPEPTDEQ